MKEMNKGDLHSSQSYSSQISLIRTRNSSVVAIPTAAQFEMTGTVQNDAGGKDDDYEPSPPKRIDTEMGGMSQTSGLESGQTPRRSTFDTQLGSG